MEPLAQTKQSERITLVTSVSVSRQYSDFAPVLVVTS